MDGLHGFIRFGRQDGKRVNGFTLVVFPCFPKSGHREKLMTRKHDVMRHFVFPPFFPLKKTITYHQTPAFFKSLSERWFLMGGFAFGIYQFISYRRIVGPKRNQPPPKRTELPGLLIGNYHLVLTRRTIKPRNVRDSSSRSLKPVVNGLLCFC